jgi:Flp pilus assembly protein TadG
LSVRGGVENLTQARRSRHRADERGGVLPLLAILLVVFMGAAAMAVDLGWLLWQSIEIQHAADASALAGVVYEPDLRTEAHTEAVAAATKNGFDDTEPGTTVTVVDFEDDNTKVEHDNQIRVTVTHAVSTFFIKIFGISDIDISRTSVAQYTPPLLMGSPDDTFGRDYSQYPPGDSNDPG